MWRHTLPALPLHPVIVERSLAAVMVAGSHPALPLSARLATRIWGLLSGLLMIGGFAYAFWGGWYWAPLGIVAGLLVEQANRRSAAEAIMSAVQEDDWFRAEMIAKKIVTEIGVDEAFMDELRLRSPKVYLDGEKLTERR